MCLLKFNLRRYAAALGPVPGAYTVQLTAAAAGDVQVSLASVGGCTS
jgi:hypothetical protein